MVPQITEGWVWKPIHFSTKDEQVAPQRNFGKEESTMHCFGINAQNASAPRNHPMFKRHFHHSQPDLLEACQGEKWNGVEWQLLVRVGKHPTNSHFGWLLTKGTRNPFFPWGDPMTQNKDAPSAIPFGIRRCMVWRVKRQTTTAKRVQVTLSKQAQ